MANDYSRDALLEFLDFLANKGLLNRSTAISRKAAVNTLLSILSPDEAADLRSLNLDDLVLRFMNIKGNEFKPESVRVYKSRLTSVLDDYGRYKKDPLGFRPRIAPRERVEKSPRTGNDKPNGSQGNPRSGSGELGEAPPSSDDPIQSIVFPIPIRPGIIVKVAGIPSDLTPDEAQKIGNVILALSGSQEN